MNLRQRVKQYADALSTRALVQRTSTCRKCGSEFTYTVNPGRPPGYCSDYCRTHRRATTSAPRQKRMTTTERLDSSGVEYRIASFSSCGRSWTQVEFAKTCECGASFWSVAPNAKRCPSCNGALTRYHRRKHTPEYLAARKARDHRRRARKLAADFGNVGVPEMRTLLETATCPMCGCELTDEHGQPNSKHVDHIVPLAIDGAHSFENLRVICRTCNLTRPNDGSDLPAQVSIFQVAAAKPHAMKKQRPRAVRSCKCCGSDVVPVKRDDGKGLRYSAYCSAECRASGMAEARARRSPLPPRPYSGKYDMQRIMLLVRLGYGYKAIARELGTTRGTARNLVRRARVLLGYDTASNQDALFA